MKAFAHLGIYVHKFDNLKFVYICRSYENPDIIQLYNITSKRGIEVPLYNFVKDFEFIGKTWIGSETQFLDYVEETDLI